MKINNNSRYREGFDAEAAAAYVAGAADSIIAGIEALDALERRLRKRQRRAVASGENQTVDAGSITKKIDALRGQFENQSLQVRYESKQKLASLLREISHVLTDLIHSMSVCGDNTDSMKKLQKQIFNVTTSLSFTGKGDADRDGFKDDQIEELGLGQGKSTKDSSKDAFLAAVKSLRTDNNSDSEDSKSEKPEEKSGKEGKESEKDEGPHGPIPNNFKKHIEEVKKHSAEKSEDGDDGDSEDAGNDDAEKPAKKNKLGKKAGKSKLGKKAGKSKKSDDSEDGGSDDEGGFVDSLMSDASSRIADRVTVASHVAVAGLRFAYLGLKKVKKSGKVVDAISAGFGTHDKPKMKVYYYLPSAKFFGGNAVKVDKAMTKLLGTPGGYSLVSTEINSRVRSGHLEVLHFDEQPAKEVLAESSTWSFKGIGEHPVKDNKKALWFEIKNQLFAAVPSKSFMGGDIDKIANYIRLQIVGSKKEGSPGVSYNEGLAKLESFVTAKQLKVIFHGSV
jgi:hypothetical protein